jgi:hypothetical protein
MVRPAGPPGVITHAVFPLHRSILRAATCCGRLPTLSGAFKARNTRDGLESKAVQLITPNLPDAADYEAEDERGQDFEDHHHC